MDSRIQTSGRFAFAMTWRTLLAAGLALALLQVLMLTHYYATALVLSALTALTIADATRLYNRLGSADGTLARSFNRDQARQLDQMAALLDAVTVALIAVTPEGHIRFSNRAARLLAGEEVGRFGDIRALGPAAAKSILALPAGARQIVTMADGRTMLVWTGVMSAPGMPVQRLISLQAVTGELDAVQVKAWADMTRVLSHEMMNSLTPISSLSESLPHLLKDHADETALRAVETIARRSRHLMNFVERYREIADLPASRPRDIALAGFIADIDALMQTHFTERGIAYRSSLNTPTVRADPELLAQAILNLLHNAADAVAGVREPAIMLSCSRADGTIQFCVSDNGPGIAPEHLPEIFVPFFTTKPGGSGIGLTLARQIALAHGGQISVAENPNGGTRLTITVLAASQEST
ncbi:MAG TPA: HAMP domain-containing sensor histidine kinase [Rhizomicrobium sp.]|nr:HAMP domain-containing sensor histidine kinase [Rhizomicrobium sp.]